MKVIEGRDERLEYGTGRAKRAINRSLAYTSCNEDEKLLLQRIIDYCQRLKTKIEEE